MVKIGEIAFLSNIRFRLNVIININVPAEIHRVTNSPADTTIVKPEFVKEFCHRTNSPVLEKGVATKCDRGQEVLSLTTKTHLAVLKHACFDAGSSFFAHRLAGLQQVGGQERVSCRVRPLHNCVFSATFSVDEATNMETKNRLSLCSVILAATVF